MSKKRAYRGKYPNRISSVEGLRKSGTYLVTTNDGAKFRVHAHENRGHTDMPDPGQEIAEFVFHPVEQTGHPLDCTCSQCLGRPNPPRHCGTAPTAESCVACQMQDRVVHGVQLSPTDAQVQAWYADVPDELLMEQVDELVEPEGEKETRYAQVLDAMWHKLNTWGSHAAAHGKLDRTHSKLKAALRCAQDIATELDKLAKEAT